MPGQVMSINNMVGLRVGQGVLLSTQSGNIELCKTGAGIHCVPQTDKPTQETCQQSGKVQLPIRTSSKSYRQNALQKADGHNPCSANRGCSRPVQDTLTEAKAD